VTKPALLTLLPPRITVTVTSVLGGIRVISLVETKMFTNKKHTASFHIPPVQSVHGSDTFSVQSYDPISRNNATKMSWPLCEVNSSPQHTRCTLLHLRVCFVHFYKCWFVEVKLALQKPRSRSRNTVDPEVSSSYTPVPENFGDHLILLCHLTSDSHMYITRLQILQSRSEPRTRYSERLTGLQYSGQSLCPWSPQAGPLRNTAWSPKIDPCYSYLTRIAWVQRHVCLNDIVDQLSRLTS
jgi:hypothetical protein